MSAHDDYTRGYLAACERVIIMMTGTAIVLETAGIGDSKMLGAALRGSCRAVAEHADDVRKAAAATAASPEAPRTASADDEATALAHHEAHRCGPYSVGGNPYEVHLGRFDAFAEALEAGRRRGGARGVLITDAHGREVYARPAGTNVETFTIPPT